MRKAPKLGPSAVPFVQAAARTVADPAAGCRPDQKCTDTFDELCDLCARRDTGSLSHAELTTTGAALLQGHNRRLSTKSPLLISGNDPYAEERAASW